MSLVAPGIGTPVARAGTAPLSGAYNGSGNVSAAGKFDSWVGNRQKVVMDFAPSDSWASLSSPTWLADDWQGKGYRLALSVPMLPASGATMSAGAAGKYNGYFTTLAKLLVAHDLGSTIIRLGWEMNGQWFNWSAVPSPTTYVQYWRQVVGAMRAVSGQSFVFDWSPNIGNGTSGFDVTSAYPGDSYVDVIGMSLYDQSWSRTTSDTSNRWNDSVNQAYGLSWNVAFAAQHGKSSGLGEWGLSKRCDPHGGGDDSYFINKIYGWITSHNYYYDTYFNHDSSSCQQHAISTGTFPNAAKTYQQLWGKAYQSAPAGLDVSWRADRADPQSLSWKGLSGRVFIFLQPSASTSQVRFYLDNTAMSGTPTWQESAAPFDFRGGTAADANGWDVSGLAKGTHTLTAAVVTSAGTQTVTSSFLR